MLRTLTTSLFRTTRAAARPFNQIGRNNLFHRPTKTSAFSQIVKPTQSTPRNINPLLVYATTFTALTLALYKYTEYVDKRNKESGVSDEEEYIPTDTYDMGVQRFLDEKQIKCGGLCLGFSTSALAPLLSTDSGNYDVLNKFDDKFLRLKLRNELDPVDPETLRLLKEQMLYQFANEHLEFIEHLDYTDREKSFTRQLGPNNQQLGFYLLHREISPIKSSCVSRFSGAYLKEDIITLLDGLKSYLDNTHFRHPVAIRIDQVGNIPNAADDRYIGHGITISYDPTEKNWILIDNNKLPSNRSLDSKNIADSIMGFSKYLEHSKYAKFSSIIYTEEKYKDELTKTINAWQRSSEWRSLHHISMRQSFDENAYIRGKQSELIGNTNGVLQLVAKQHEVAALCTAAMLGVMRLSSPTITFKAFKCSASLAIFSFTCINDLLSIINTEVLNRMMKKYADTKDVDKNFDLVKFFHIPLIDPDKSESPSPISHPPKP